MTSHHDHRSPSQQHGVVAVEFALVAVVLFLFIFGVMEVSRIIFVWSTMTEVTNRAARAAAMAPFNATDQLRQAAMFLTAPDQKMILGGEIGPGHLRIDYLGPDAATAVTPPENGAANTVTCLGNPNDAACIRFVRVRLCQPGAGCSRVPYVPMTMLPGMEVLKINMPLFTAIAPVATLGAFATSP